MSVGNQRRYREWGRYGVWREGEEGVMNCIVSLKNSHIQALTVIPQTVFGDRAFKEVIKIK